jgi:short-subunit dehydrogenase
MDCASPGDAAVTARSLSGAVVAVLGASGGLGTPITKLVHERGARLILVGPHHDRLTATSRDLGLLDAVVVQSDIRDTRCGDQIVEASRTLGRLDGVVNATGVVAFGSLIDTPDDLIEELFLVNVLGPMWMMKRVAPMLAESKGFVTNISGVVAEMPMANMAAYSASKAALRSSAEALGREFRRLGITVCDARPPHTETGLATRPISGTAPKMPEGLSPERVAAVIVTAIESGATEIASSAFTEA